MRFNRSSPSPLVPLYGVVAEVCHCQLVTINRGRDGVQYVGRDPWPVAAAYLHYVVTAAAMRALMEFRGSTAYRRHHRVPARQAAEHHYLQGFMAALAGKLRALKAARHEQEEQRRDLALADRALADLPEHKSRRRPRPVEHFVDAAMNGVRAGENVQVAWGVGQSAVAGRLAGR